MGPCRALGAFIAATLAPIAAGQSIIAGPVTSPVNGHTYYLLSASSWFAGENAALSLGGHLATVRSSPENEFARQLLRTGGVERRGWIGLHSTSSGLLWTTPGTIYFDNWRPGEQPDLAPPGRCAELSSIRGDWALNDPDPSTSVRLLQFARRFYTQSCRCVIVGDSINSEGSVYNMPYGYCRALHPQHWAGWGNAGNPGGSPASYVLEVTPDTYGWTLSGFGFGFPGVIPSGGWTEASIWPSLFGDTNIWFRNSAPFYTIFGVHFPAAARALFQGGDWLLPEGAVRHVLYRGGVGLPQIGAQTVRGGAQVTSITSQALPPGYTFLDTAIGSGPADAEARLWAVWPDADETGQNIYYLGSRWYIPGAEGLELSFGGVGGSKVADHINTTRVSDAAIAARVAAFDLDTVIIWLGTNDIAVDDAWAADYQTLIQRWRSAITADGRTPRFLLIAPYDVGNPQHANIPARLIAMAQSSSDVSFYNLWADTGPQACLTGRYLRDGVHPNLDGAIQFASLIDEALRHALASEPIPSIFPIVEVPCYANCDGSSIAPLLNINDFVCFQQHFAAGNAAANCDGSTTPPLLNVNDFVCFIQKYASGCP